MPGLDTVIEALGGWTKGLIPDSNADERTQYLWRVRIGVTASVTFLGLIASVFLAFGGLSWLVHFDGFARASDVVALGVSQKADLALLATSQQQDIAQIIAVRDADKAQAAKDRIATLDTRILDLKIKQCQATTPEGRQLYWSRIQPRMDEFTALSGRAYTLPDCKDL